ncbi:MAG: adenylate kinase [Defluviitaleaceae bacterium]|nr:adenylate kinase [Defluviitaleaceae bacterium]MCL2836666.1 adenylate kinase [Defluviitaleaceae bacterium]
MRIIVIGAPGAGKGTQAKLLAKHFNVPHVSTGSLLREYIEKNTGTCDELKHVMNCGYLVDDDIVIGLIRGFVEDKAFIFDGFPRTVKQAEILNEMLSAISAPLNKVIYVTIDDDIIIGRMAGRQSCSSCGAIYNTKHNPPAAERICDHCGGALFVREDDCEQVVRRRLRNYYTLTEPIIDYYRKQGIVFEISGLGCIDEITNAVIAELS